MAILLLAPPFMSALSASLQRETELHPQRWSNGQPYYLSLGKECPWMWPKFSEYNNKYLKCLATVRLINKLFTTPPIHRRKTFSGFTWSLVSINLKVLQTHSSDSSVINTDEHGRNFEVCLIEVNQMKPWSTWKNKTRKFCLPPKE